MILLFWRGKWIFCMVNTYIMILIWRLISHHWIICFSTIGHAFISLFCIGVLNRVLLALSSIKILISNIEFLLFIWAHRVWWLHNCHNNSILATVSSIVLHTLKRLEIVIYRLFLWSHLWLGDSWFIRIFWLFIIFLWIIFSCICLEFCFSILRKTYWTKSQVQSNHTSIKPFH